MATYSKTISGSSLIQRDDGIWVGTVLASQHGLGNTVHVTRATFRNEDDLSFDNIAFAYHVDINGNVEVYTDVQEPYRITICDDYVEAGV